jgi:hypothetical protein
MLPTRQPCIFNRLRKAEEVNEYFVRGAEQICRTVSLVGVPSFDDSKWFIEEIGRAPRQSPAAGFEPPQVAIASDRATADGGPRSALRTTEFSALSLLSGLLDARSGSCMFPNRDGRAK